MNVFKRMLVLATLVAMIDASTPNLAAAEEEVSDVGECGVECGYEQSRSVPSLAPAIALGTIAIVAIIAVAVQNNSHHHHAHAHGHN
jgi:hypothetical protein